MTEMNEIPQDIGPMDVEPQNPSGGFKRVVMVKDPTTGKLIEKKQETLESRGARSNSTVMLSNGKLL